ncbi:MAG TPA: hypothetical protein VJ546_01110 [Bacillales bacterium]|nr:hypothetical protein [Bacillales bacterium]
MKETFENGEISTEQEKEIPELTIGEWKNDELSYYELTEAVLQYHMRKL